MDGTGRWIRSATTVPVLALVTALSYACHARPLTTGLIDLVLVMVTAFRWGFIEAAFASVGAIAFLDFFYMPPIFSFYENDPQDWISSAIFILITLRISRFADRLRRQAIDTSRERTRLEKLYLTSRDIILMNRQDVGAQLTLLIEDTFKVDAVALWDARTFKMDKAGGGSIAEEDVRAVYFNELSEDDPASHTFKRVLRLGTKPVGSLYIAAASSPHSYLDPRSMDAIASLAAIALERAHSFIAESNAEAAKQSEQLRSTVLDGLAHAYKTPLATIQTATSGLLEIPHLGTAEKELASLIDEAAGRLTILTDKVLETAELNEGQLKVDSEEIDLNHFLQQCRMWFEPILATHPVRLFNETSIPSVCADMHLLQMALLQLIDNASKYGRPASPITLRVASTDSEIIFSVENEGSYVAPEESARIFQRFYRAQEARYMAPGTGIGLSVTKRIAEAHDGRVWVESDRETGTTFFLALPQKQKEPSSGWEAKQNTDCGRRCVA